MEPGRFPGLQNQWPANSGRWVRFPSASASLLLFPDPFLPVFRQLDLLGRGEAEIAVVGEGVGVGAQRIA